MKVYGVTREAREYLKNMKKKELSLYSERQIQQQIIHWLQYHGWMVLRLNSGKYSVGEGRSKRFIMGQERGTPDLMAFQEIPTIGRFRTMLYFIEVKRPGKNPTDIQKQRMKELEEYGARCIVIHSIEELEKQI